MQGNQRRMMSPPVDKQEITSLGEDAKAKKLPPGITVMLRVLEGQEPGRGYQIEKSPVTIGRDSMCDVSIPDTRMSRQHCMLFYYSPTFYIKDLGSTNGTFVNDKRVKQSEMKNGDHIQVGSTVLELIVSGREQAGE